MFYFMVVSMLIFSCFFLYCFLYDLFNQEYFLIVCTYVFINQSRMIHICPPISVLQNILALYIRFNRNYLVNQVIIIVSRNLLQNMLGDFRIFYPTMRKSFNVLFTETFKKTKFIFCLHFCTQQKIMRNFEISETNCQ